MSLGTILTKLGSIGAIKLGNDEQLAYAINQVNAAAEELYRENDLINGLVEQVLNIDPTIGNQITLPADIGTVRALRYYWPQLRLSTVDMRPRYAARFWQAEGFLDFRVKPVTPLIREISNTAILTITLRSVLTYDVTITITGSTDSAAKVSENIVIPAGVLTVNSVNSYNDIKVLAKNFITEVDVDIFDIDGNLLSTIPNSQLTAQYVLLQVLDIPNVPNGANSSYQPISNYIEMLWKPRYTKLVNQTDEFQCPGYDDAIFWKWKEHRALYKEPPDTTSAAVCLAQCNKIVKDIASEHDMNLKKSINFGVNATYEAFRNLRGNSMTGYDYAMPAGCPYSNP